MFESIQSAVAARGAAQRRLHEAACASRDSSLGRGVFVRAVVEISNFCRENCSYCGMRRDNRGLARRRLDPAEMADWILETCPDTVTDINLQAGEDPVAAREVALPLLELLSARGRWGLSVCFGTLSEKDYAALRRAGADYYVIKIETGDPEHYRSLASPGTLGERIAAIRHLAATGWNVSSGFIQGLPGQTPATLERTFRLLETLPLAGSSVSPFIPSPETPLAGAAAAEVEDVLNSIALMRTAFPRRIIPAVSALELRQPGAYSRALRAGANLVTINLTPPAFRPDYLLYRRERIIMDEQRVLEAVAAAGLEPRREGISEFLRRGELSRAA